MATKISLRMPESILTAQGIKFKTLQEKLLNIVWNTFTSKKLSLKN